jgi:hypothetical protein
MSDRVRGGEWVQPEWWGPQQDWIGSTLPFNLLLGHNTECAVVVESVMVYPNGIAFDLRATTGKEGILLAADSLEFGVEFSDGRRAARGTPVGGPGKFSIDGYQRGETHVPDLDLNVVLHFTGGGSGAALLGSCFLWPYPPDGQLVFFCAWPTLGLRESKIEIEGDNLREALRKAHPVWGLQTSLDH